MRIGIFDTGYGGLTVFRDIAALLPQYDYLYLGDNARAPYGELDLDTITRYAWEATQHLFEQDCSLIIFACNTVSANALRNIQQKYLSLMYPRHRVLGVIRPSIEYLAGLPGGSHVAVWGTSATINSDSYGIEGRKYAPEVNLIQIACTRLAPLIESGDLRSTLITESINTAWRQTTELSPSPDALLLACTHFPIVEKQIARQCAGVKIITQGKLTATRLEDYLYRHPEIETGLSKQGVHEFMTTGNTRKFDAMSEMFLTRAVRSQETTIS